MSIFVVLTIWMLFVWGLIACYGLIVAQAPDIKEKFDLIIPFQGIIWAILILMWFRELFRIWLILKLLNTAPFFGILGLCILLSEFILWFILAYGLITKMITSNQKASEKVNATYNTLVIVQVPFGMLSILLAMILLIVNIIY